MVVARLGFKRRATAVLKSNLIRSIEFGTAVARPLKWALERLLAEVSSQTIVDQLMNAAFVHEIY